MADAMKDSVLLHDLNALLGKMSNAIMMRWLSNSRAHPRLLGPPRLAGRRAKLAGRKRRDLVQGRPHLRRLRKVSEVHVQSCQQFL